tara:strand:- start:3716 stop:4519 length:804 start_codon:yes stop_codon:yes gene_type:complete
MDKTIILFDMDGTLTEPRKQFNSKEIQQSFYQLINKEVEIGIITGSDEDYLREQMGSFLSDSSCRYKMHLMPCNGTKYLKPPNKSKDDYKLIHEVSMEKHLGHNKYRELIHELIYSQVDMANSGVPLSGHFINCRGTMINWCPIGRNASAKQREDFIRIDAQDNLRSRVIKELRAMLRLKNLEDKITIKIGGDTSFDIYPSGWDKTYGLRHFKGWDVWFIGDRCDPDGNDYELYQACNGRSYVSSGPKNTNEIITCIMKRLGEYNES